MLEQSECDGLEDFNMDDWKTTGCRPLADAVCLQEPEFVRSL